VLAAEYFYFISWWNHAWNKKIWRWTHGGSSGWNSLW